MNSPSARSEHESHEIELRARLATGGVREPVAFAAACAERLWSLVGNEAGVSTRKLITRALGTLWSLVLDRPDDNAPLAGLEAELESQLQHVGELQASEAMLREEDALVATLYAVRQVRLGGVDCAVWAARQEADAVDRTLQTALGVRILTQADETSLASHPASKAVRDLQRASVDTLLLEGRWEDRVAAVKRMPQYRPATSS